MKEQKTSFSNENGEVSIPEFKVHLIQVFAQGFQPVNDTVNALTKREYILQSLKIQMGEVVITGQYHANEVSNSVYDVQVFDQKNIELRAANNLGDLLQQENNILISHDPFLGSGININGITGNNVKILQDGVPVIGRENGNIDISQLDLSNIERVEVVRGPMSETYGSDALAGVINLISKKKSADGFSGGSKFYYESNGTYNVHAHAALRKKKQELSLHIGRNFFDGYSAFDSLRSKQWKPKEQYLADLGYAYHINNGYIRYSGNVSSEKLISKGNVNATPYAAYAFDDYYNTVRMSHKLFTELELKNHAAINLTNAFSNYERSRDSYRKDMVLLKQSGIASNNYSNLFRQYLFRGTYSTFQAWKKINYQAGYDITLDEARGDRTGSTTRKINDFALFGSAELTLLKKVLIRPAMRVIYNSRYPAPFVPSLQIKYDPFKTVTLRVSFARGFRAPSVKELYLDFEDSNHNLLGNTDLKPELSEYFRIALTYQKKIQRVEFSLQPDFFFNHIYNKISLAQVNNNALVYTYINLDDYRNVGGNFAVSAAMAGIKIGSGINLTAYHNDLAASTSKQGYNKSMNINASLSYAYEKAGITAGVFYKHTGATTLYSLNQDEIITYYINDYNTMDFTLSKSLFKKSIIITGGLKNIFNVTTTTGGISGDDVHSSGEDVTLLGMGRYYFAGLQFNIPTKTNKK